jgi:hypothetical protein
MHRHNMAVTEITTLGIWETLLAIFFTHNHIKQIFYNNIFRILLLDWCSMSNLAISELDRCLNKLYKLISHSKKAH